MQALREIWLVGDIFLWDSFAILQRLKIDAGSTNRPPPYIYDYYNVSVWYPGTSTIKQCITRIYNAFISALNKSPLLPKYVLIIPDCDIILGTKFDYGMSRLLEEQIDWLIRQLNKAIHRRCDDLKAKRPGAISSSFEPRVIWIKAINRPFDDDENTKKIRAAIGKYNNYLTRALVAEKYIYMSIMHIDSLDDLPANFFNLRGYMSDSGKTQMWREIDMKIKKFDRHEIHLKPSKAVLHDNIRPHSRY